VLFAEFFEYYLAHQKAATTLMHELTTVLKTACADASPGMQHQCRTDFLARILYGEDILKQATTITDNQEMNALLRKEAYAFNRCLEQPARARRSDVWV
jgi:hypothetical protein